MDVEEFAFRIVDAFNIKGRGTVICAHWNSLAVPLQIGDVIELRGTDRPMRTQIRAIEMFHTDEPSDLDLRGIMVSPELSIDFMRRNSEVWRINPKLN